MGLVHRVTPTASLADAADELLAETRRLPREARAAAKAALRRGADVSLRDGLRIEAALVSGILSLPD